MAAPNHGARSHAKFSPSASKRWLSCPASIRLSEKCPPQVDSLAAREGTEAHECLEFIVKNRGAERNARHKWSDDKVDYAQDAFRSIMSLRPDNTAKLLIETKVAATDRVTGTLDYAWVTDFGRLVVIDYKFGSGVAVSPIEDDGTENSQLMTYAVGLARRYDYEFDAVELVIIQPRAQGETVKRHLTTVRRLREFEAKLKKGVSAAERPDAPTRAGDHCRWCPAKSICPELSENTLRAASLFVDDSQELVASPDPLHLDPENAGRLLVLCERLEMWTKAVKERAFLMLRSGQKVPGFKLVEKRAVRQWTAEAETKAFDLFKEGIFESKMLSPAQLEKKFGKPAKEFTKQFTISVSAGVTIAPESDKRPEAISNTQDLFNFESEEDENAY